MMTNHLQKEKNMENTQSQSHGIKVVEFYTWSKNGHTSSRLYITMNGGFVLGGQLAEEGFAGSVPLNVLARVKVNRSKMKELESLYKKGY